MKKRTLLILISTVVLLCLLAVQIINSDTNSNKTPLKGVEIELGDFIEFGSYLSEPIIWKVIDFNNDGDPLLLSKDIISVKSYDSIGEKHKNQLDKVNTNTGDSLRQTKGSNYWETSNIRQWLNSESKKIEWLRNPPLESPTLGDEIDGYANEAGFLNNKNFSSEELNVLNLIEYKVLLNMQDIGISEGGSQAQLYSNLLVESTTDYKLSYYQVLKDRVILLSTQELKELLYDRGWEITTKSTRAAYVEVFGDDFGYINGSFFSDYWLRTPICDMNKPMNSIIVMPVSTKVTNIENHDLGEQVTTYSSGIRPVISIDLKNILFMSGTGRFDLPYESKSTIK